MTTDALFTLPDAKVSTLLYTLAATDPDFQQQVNPLAEALQNLVLTTSEQNTLKQANLARESLAALAEEPEFSPRLAVLQSNTSVQKYVGDVGSVAVMAAVLFLLRSHIQFERTSGGKWRFRFEHKPMENKLLVALLKKIEQWLSVDITDQENQP